MPRSTHRRRTPSPSAPIAPGQNVPSAEKTGRKSSLATSLQNLAKSTFHHPRTRRSNAGTTVDNGATAAPTAPSPRSTSLPLKSRRSLLPRLNSHNALAASSTTQQPQQPPPVPPLPPTLMQPLPAIPNRSNPGSRLPTPSHITTAAAGARLAMTRERQKENENQNKPSSVRKPFVGYRDVKSLSSLGNGIINGRNSEERIDPIKGKGKARFSDATHRSRLPISPSKPGISQRGGKNTNTPLPNSSSLTLLGSSRRASVLPPIATCKSVHAIKDGANNTYVHGHGGFGSERPKEQPAKTAGKSERAQSRHCITSHQLGQQFGAQKLPKSQTLGNLISEGQHSMASLPSSLIVPNNSQREYHNEDRNIIQEGSRESPGCFEERFSSDTTIKDTEDIKMVRTPKPQQYWLGRFTTLMSSFQHEAAFNEPDPATGYGIAGNQLEGKSPISVNLDEYHTKRAFMVLERVCMTAEAIASFTDFREAYSRRYGRRFSERFAGEIDVGITLSPKAGGKGKGAAKNIRSRTQAIEVHDGCGQRRGGMNGSESVMMHMLKSVRKSFA